MLKINREALIETKPQSVRCLYDKYAGMLFGYIFEVIKDRKLAEEYLVKIFCDLSERFNEITWEGTNNWCQLQRFAKKKLADFNDRVKYDDAPVSGLIVHLSCNKYLDQLNETQKQVFCDVYYHGKSIADISGNLKQTEDSIRKTLKEAFAIMRQGGEN